MDRASQLARRRRTRRVRNRRIVTLIAAFAVALAFAQALPLASGSPGHGQFLVRCAYDHSAHTDPIVFPNQPDMSHAHDFEGARGVDAFSTVSRLIATHSTTCGDTADTAGYWHPQLLTGCPTNADPAPMLDCPTTVQVTRTAAYYDGFSETTNYPVGFTVKWGDPKATAPQGRKTEYWGCGTHSRIPRVDTFPNCNGVSHNVEAHIKFPDCWDGNISPSGRYDVTDPATGSPYVATDSSSPRTFVDHGNGTCPPGYPTHLPALTFAVFWSCKPSCPDPAHTMLSSGTPFGFHGDYMDAWQPGTLENLVSRCLVAEKNCGEIKSDSTIVRPTRTTKSTTSTMRTSTPTSTSTSTTTSTTVVLSHTPCTVHLAATRSGFCAGTFTPDPWPRRP